MSRVIAQPLVLLNTYVRFMNIIIMRAALMICKHVRLFKRHNGRAVGEVGFFLALSRFGWKGLCVCFGVDVDVEGGSKF